MSPPLSKAKRLATRLTLSLLLTLPLACEKKAPPDPYLAKGFTLLGTNPEEALSAFKQSREPESPKAKLGKALALEGLRRYADAHQEMKAVSQELDEEVVWQALTRLEIMLGKRDAAKEHVDLARSKAPAELMPLLLATCVADDPKRAEAALDALDTWTPKNQANSPRSLAPAEYHLARASLLMQLGRARDRAVSLKKSKQSHLRGDSEALSLAVMAAAAGRRDFANTLLERATDDITSSAQLRQVAFLAHELGQHKLTSRVLDVIHEKDAAVWALQARHEFAIAAPQATQTIKRALKQTTAPGSKDALELLLAQSLLRDGQLEQARATATPLIKVGPVERPAKLVLARIALAEGNSEAALKQLEPLLAEPVLAGAREIAALAWAAQKKYQRAAQHLKQLLKEDPNHPSAAKLLVALQLKANDTDAAVQTVSTLIKQAPGNPSLRLLQAELMNHLGKTQSAAEALGSSVDALPNQARLWIELARHHHRQKHHDQAIEVLQEAHKRNPENQLLAAALATDLTRAARAKEAAPLFEELLERSQKDVVALNNLAMFYADELNAPDKAVEFAEKANKLAPKKAAIIDTLGWSLYRQNTPESLERAEKLLERVRSDLKSPGAKYHLGAVLIARGKEKEGKALLRQAISLSQSFNGFEEARALLEQGE